MYSPMIYHILLYVNLCEMSGDGGWGGAAGARGLVRLAGTSMWGAIDKALGRYLQALDMLFRGPGVWLKGIA